MDTDETPGRIHPSLTGGATNLEPTDSLLDFVDPAFLRDLIDMRDELFGDGAQFARSIRGLRERAALHVYDVTVRRSKTEQGVVRVAAPDERAARLAAVDEYRRLNELPVTVQLFATQVSDEVDRLRAQLAELEVIDEVDRR